MRFVNLLGLIAGAAAAQAPPRGYSIPTLDLAGDTSRQVIVDREPGQYLGHPTTVLLADGKTMLCVYPKGHGKGAIVLKRSRDAGRTWSDRLPVPDNWSTSLETPTIHSIGKRLVLFSGLYPIRKAVSEDNGVTWTPLEPAGDFGGIVAMADLIRLRDGRHMAVFHDDGRFISAQPQPGAFKVYKTLSSDGGLTWSAPVVIVRHPQGHLCEPGLVRSPDGKQLAMLLRENSRKFNSFVAFSDDEGDTWSEPRELPGALTGDRHLAKYAPDGRLLATFRDTTHESPTRGDWVAWVGRYEDLREGREGQYRVRLMKNHRAADCCYAGLELLPGATFVTTTYGHWTPGQPPYVVSVRLSLEELDRMAPLAGLRTVPGEVTTPYPTIVNLAVEWKIAGDDNENSRVAVAYRRRGEAQWRAAMPLRRVVAGQSTGTRPIFRWDNKHSGSIFDLRPNTEYEIRLTLSDPDGGSAERIVRAKTRPVPRPARDSRSVRVTPETLAAAAAAALPGDTLVLAPGRYGTFHATRDGTPEKPLVFRAAVRGEAVFERFDLAGRKHVQLEGVTVNGPVNLLGGEDLAVRRCTVNSKYGIIASRAPGVRNSYIADNVVTYIMPWDRNRMGAEAPPGYETCEGEGIQITGPGNVICHNRVKGYRDCISFMEDTYAHEQVGIDVYGNDIYVGDDDAIEADFAMGNCRILRNRITNCFMGLSSQPGLGGPTYFIRNVMYNLTNAPFKLARRSVGDVVLHNTVVKVGDGLVAPHQGWSRALFRNNLCIGGQGGGMFGRYHSGPGLAVSLPGPDSTCDLDYDGAGTHGTPFRGRVRDVFFSSIEEMRSRTSHKHAVQVDMSVFDGVEFPDPPIPERPVPDLRIRAGSAAADAGQPLANINDGFRGRAPDLGAYEAGQPLPVYGPRPEGVDEDALPPRAGRRR